MMVLKVDLQCCRCYKKVKKVLCSIPEIQDQEYNEKENLVVIKVVCCNPEKIKQKLICKGCGCIKSVEIPPPPPPPLTEEEKKKKRKEEEERKKKQEEERKKREEEERKKKQEEEKKRKEEEEKKKREEEEKKKKEIVLAIPLMPFFPFGYGVCCGQCYGGGPCHCGCGGRGNPPEQPTRRCCGPCSEGRPGGPCHCGCGGHCNPPKQPPAPAPAPAPPVHPPRSCCGPCSEGRPGGPCHYEGYGRPVCDSYSGGYYCQENPSGCTFM
ncbi:protein PYRICULARIA ORYZAE RESISTANCE 21 isoform X4 [Fagus crenata]